jgi:hypothetical protein
MILSRLTASILILVIAAAAGYSGAHAQALPHRWVFSHGYGRGPDDVARIRSLVETAADSGLNGLVLSSFGLDEVTRWRENDIALLEEIRDLCEEKGIELIPIGFSAGHGGGVLMHHPDFAAALPLAVGLVADGGRAVEIITTGNLIINGGFERYAGDSFEDFIFHDRPGEVSFVDTTVAASGRSSIRFENFSPGRHGLGRVMQEVEVRPGCSYRYSVKIKTEGLHPVQELQLLVLGSNGEVMKSPVDVRPTQGWTEVSARFTNFSETKLSVYAGIWGGEKGTFWLDDIELRQESSLAGIVRREGAQVELNSRDRKMAFAEGTDFTAERGPDGLMRIELVAGTGIKEGEKLSLSCYTTAFVHKAGGRQVSLCMSNPDLYAYWEEQARELHRITRFKRFFLSMDEIRSGGGCGLCRDSGMSMAQILGNCITRLHGILKGIDPEIEVLIWSDMLDPGHNARDEYFGIVGSFSGSWEYVPKDLIIVCWHQERMAESLGFFAGKGFRTIGAAYYDAGDLESSRRCLESLGETPGAIGIIYTSWEKKYGLLADFGDMVSGTVAPVSAPVIEPLE